MNNNRKLICTDLDGTLIFRNDKGTGEYEVIMHDKDRQALIELQKQGHSIAVVTGREKQGIRRFLQDSFVAFDYYVATNGSLILNQHFDELHKKQLESNIVEELLHFMAQNYPEAGMMATTGFKMYFFNGTYENDQVQHREGVELLTKDTYEPRKHPFIMMNVNIDKSYGENRTEKIGEIETRLLEKFGDRLNVFRNKDFIDIAPLGNSKGNAVKKIAGILDIALTDVYTIGDSWNDLSMLEIPEVQSYTFHHADKALQNEAKYVVSSFAEMADTILIK